KRLHSKVRSAWCASLWAKSTAIDAFTSFTLDRIAEHVALPASEPLQSELTAAVKGVLALEAALFTSPDIDWGTAHLSIKEQVDLRRFLRAQEHVLANEGRVLKLLSDTLTAMFFHLVDALPKIDGAATLTVPVIDHIANPADVLERMFATFIDQEVLDAGLF